MNEPVNNIRVYRIKLKNGSSCFHEKQHDACGGTATGSMPQMAAHVKSLVAQILVKDTSMVSIDFKPFHDIEYTDDLQPRLCTPLTAAEQVEFWKHYTKN